MVLIQIQTLTGELHHQAARERKPVKGLIKDFVPLGKTVNTNINVLNVASLGMGLTFVEIKRVQDLLTHLQVKLLGEELVLRQESDNETIKSQLVQSTQLDH